MRTLDRPQPQVEIEARIVQLNRNSARDLGIQWGFNGKVDPAFGTSTGLAFPSSGGVTAGTGGVNAANPSAVGLALGSINGALNLDVSLRALESDGKGRILATPRVATQNNVEAEITQGSQIPIQMVSNNTVTVHVQGRRVDAARHAADHRVEHRDHAHLRREGRAELHADDAAQPVPSIDTQRAVTTVLMGDGETTVIGGIYTREESGDLQPHAVPASRAAARLAVQDRIAPRGQRRAPDLHHSADREVGTYEHTNLSQHRVGRLVVGAAVARLGVVRR